MMMMMMMMKQERVPNTALKGYIEGRRPIEGSEGDGWKQWTGMLREMWKMDSVGRERDAWKRRIGEAKAIVWL